MQERTGVAAENVPAQTERDISAEGKARLSCREVVLRYELMRYNLFKEKYEKNGQHGV